MAKKRGTLGKGAESIDLKEPHGLAPTVAPPPPPPKEDGKPVVPKPVPKSPVREPDPADMAVPAAAGWLSDEPAISKAKPAPIEPVQEKPAATPAKAPEVRKIDLSLLPWVVKKQIAGETDREDLDFRVIFAVKGHAHCLVMEGHRNDFGRFYAADHADLGNRYVRWSQSDFSRLPSDEALLLVRGDVEGVLVESAGYALELGSLDDLLDWCGY